MAESKKVAPKKEVKATPKSDKIELVKMAKGDRLADVHPLEVDNFKACGYTVTTK